MEIKIPLTEINAPVAYTPAILVDSASMRHSRAGASLTLSEDAQVLGFELNGATAHFTDIALSTFSPRVRQTATLHMLGVGEKTIGKFAYITRYTQNTHLIRYQNNLPPDETSEISLLRRTLLPENGIMDFVPAPANARLPTLTPAMQSVADLIAMSKTYKEIAEIRSRSLSTIGTTSERILDHYKLHSRSLYPAIHLMLGAEAIGAYRQGPINVRTIPIAVRSKYDFALLLRDTVNKDAVPIAGSRRSVTKQRTNDVIGFSVNETALMFTGLAQKFLSPELREIGALKMMHATPDVIRRVTGQSDSQNNYQALNFANALPYLPPEDAGYVYLALRKRTGMMYVQPRMA